jgi:hypothetical protein
VPVIDTEIVVALMDLYRLFPQVETLTYHPDHGLGIEDPRGWNAVFGRDGDMSLKVKIYAELVEMLLKQGRKVDFISVEDTSAPYYHVER